MKRAVEKKRSLLPSCLLSQIYWLVSALLLLLIFCSIANAIEDPDSIMKPLALCALYLSAVIGGIGAVRLSGDGPVSGALSGLFTALIVFLLSAFPFPSSGLSTTLTWLLTLAIIPFSVLGAVLGQRKKKKPRKPLQRRRR